MASPIADQIYVGQSLAIPGAPDSPTSAPTVHIVAPGETLGLIAGQYGTTADAIAALNGITNQNVIYVGTQLTVSGTPVAVAPNIGSSTGTYVVQAGDTLSEIAADHGVSTADLAAANSISNQHFLKIGQVLTVPNGGSGFLLSRSWRNVLQRLGLSEIWGKVSRGQRHLCSTRHAGRSTSRWICASRRGRPRR